MFTNALQSVESLKDLFENYDSSFIVEYLSKIKGFNNKEAAEYCISKIKYRKEIAASDAVYENIYEKLVDFILKGKYTRYHNNAKKKISRISCVKKLESSRKLCYNNKK